MNNPDEQQFEKNLQEILQSDDPKKTFDKRAQPSPFPAHSIPEGKQKTSRRPPRYVEAIIRITAALIAIALLMMFAAQIASR